MTSYLCSKITYGMPKYYGAFGFRIYHFLVVFNSNIMAELGSLIRK